MSLASRILASLTFTVFIKLPSLILYTTNVPLPQCFYNLLSTSVSGQPVVIIVAGCATIRHGVITNFPYMPALAQYGIRGTLPDLMAEVAEDHVRTHLVHPVAHPNRRARKRRNH